MTFQRVMASHRAVNSEELKFKRINKAKSRSLGELRGKLTLSSSTNDEDLEDLEEDAQTNIIGPNQCRLKLRSIGAQRSLSLDQESTTDASTN